MPSDRLTWASVVIAALLFLSHPALAEHDTSPVAPFEPREGDVLVFLTERASERVDFPQILESFLLTRFSQREFRTYTSDMPELIADESVVQLEEIAAQHPTAVIIAPSLMKLGDNDLNEDSFQSFRGNLQELHRRIRALPAEPTYLSPLMFDVHRARRNSAVLPPDISDYVHATRSFYGTWLREFAADSSARFVDLQGPLENLTRLLRASDAEVTDAPNGLPNAAGQLAIAAAVLEQWGLERPLSSIQIARNDEHLSVTAEGGRVFNIHSDNAEILSFFWLADALPWMAPAELQSSAELLKIPERFSHETLQVSGLRDGRYLLLVDDLPIGKFSAADFEDGISLERLATPQSEQAKAVVEANSERTKTLIFPARKLARSIAEQRRTLDKVRLAELERERQRLARAAEASWNQLREDSQPIPRRFVIRPIPTVQVQGRVFVAGMPVSGAAVELHGMQGLAATGTTDAMGFFELTPKAASDVPTGEAWLVVLAQMVLPKFVSLESSGHRMLLRTGVNEIELHFEEMLSGE